MVAHPLAAMIVVYVLVYCTRSTHPQLKSIAAVLLRRIFLQLEYKDIAEDLEESVLRASKAELLLALQSETPAHIRRKMCDAVAEIARSYLGVCVGAGGGVLSTWGTVIVNKSTYSCSIDCMM